MNEVLCFLCAQKCSENTNSTPAKEIYSQTIGYQFPDDAEMCYLCRHQFEKFDKFRKFCLHKHFILTKHVTDDISIERLKTPFDYATKTITDVLLCTFSDCIETSKETEYSTEENSTYFDVKSNQSAISDDLNVRSIEIDKELTHIYDDSNSESDKNASDYDNNFNKEMIPPDSIKPELNDNESITNELNERKLEEVQIKFTKIVLTLEEQRADLEVMRKSKKFIDAQFKCYNCALTFPFKDSYRSHMVRHEESNGEYCCAVCGVRFATRDAHRMHRVLHSERHVCSACGAGVKPGAAWRSHAERCAGVVRSCGHCHMTFSDITGLQQHMRRAHKSKKSTKDAKVYRCNICNQVYKNASSLRVHTITHGNTRYDCPSCPAKFNTPYALKSHEARHTDSVRHYCRTCDKWFKYRKTYVAHLERSNAHCTQKYECPLCDHITPRPDILQQHMRSHRPPRLACRCGRRFPSDEALRRHEARHGRARPSVLCHKCAATVKGKSKLKRHLQSTCKANLTE